MRKNKKGQAWLIGVIAVVIIAIIAVIYALAAYDTVDASHIGVKNRFGETQGTIIAGLHHTGVFTHVEQYNLRLRTVEVKMLQGAESSIDKEGQAVYAKIIVNYRLNPANVEKAYADIGMDVDLEKTLALDGLIREGFKSVTSKYTSKEIWQNRDKVKEEAIVRITGAFPEEYFILNKVYIPDLDFNPEFLNAIEQKKTNTELALAKAEEVAIATAEANMKIETAVGNKREAELKADAEAYQIKAKADADAHALLAIATAEAEGLRLKKAELTPLMVQNNWIDSWNGQVPTYMFGGEETSLLLQMPQ